MSEHAARRKLSRDLLMVLRHSAPLHGLLVDVRGFVNVDDLLEHVLFQNSSLTDIQVVSAKYPDRLEIIQIANSSNAEVPSIWRIRARAGHSIQHVQCVHDEDISTAEASELRLVLSTTRTNWKRIKKAGVVKGSPYINLMPEVPPADSEKNVLAFLDVGAAVRAGVKVFRLARGRFISCGDATGSIPLALFSRVEIPACPVQPLATDCPSAARSHSSKMLDGIAQKVDSAGISADRWLAAFVSQPLIQRAYYMQSDLSMQRSAQNSDCDGPAASIATVHGVGTSRGGVGGGNVCAPNGGGDHGGGDNAREDTCYDAGCDAGAGGKDGDDIHLSTSPPSCASVIAGAHGDRMAADSRSSASVSSVHAQKWVIMPVAIPGCGKTGVCVGLAFLFGFAHIQVGDIEQTNTRAGVPNPFLNSVALQLKENNVVVADRNNHLRKHRSALQGTCDAAGGRVNILALNWNLRQPSMLKVHSCCEQRIISWRRGQAWFVPGRGTSLHDVLWKFLDDAQPLLPDEVACSVDMDPLENLEDGLKRAASGVAALLGLDMPAEGKLKEAVQAARSYHPKLRMPPREVTSSIPADV